MDALALLLVPIAANRIAEQFGTAIETDAVILRRNELAAQPSTVLRLVRPQVAHLSHVLVSLSETFTRRPAH